MGREIKRVPLDFNHPMNKVWDGFLMPDDIYPDECTNPDCNDDCKACDDEGFVFRDEEHKKAYENWEDTEPPEGEGYQIWETVSEGSPISPVFKNKDKLVEWLVKKGYSTEGAEAFAEQGWVMSGIISGGVYYKDIESAKV